MIFKIKKKTKEHYNKPSISDNFSSIVNRIVNKTFKISGTFIFLLSLFVTFLQKQNKTS